MATSRDPRTPLDFALTGKHSDECAEFIKSKGGKTYSELKAGEFEDAEFHATPIQADEERFVKTDNKKRLRSSGEIIMIDKNGLLMGDLQDPGTCL